MALVVSLANWDEPSVSSFAAWTARELNEVGEQQAGEVYPKLMLGFNAAARDTDAEGYQHAETTSRFVSLYQGYS